MVQDLSITANRIYCRTDAEQDENALIGCLLLCPKATSQIPLVHSDFYELGCGEAFTEIKSQVQSLNEMDCERFGIDPNDFYVDIHRMTTALRESVGRETGSLMADWIDKWVDYWHWRYYAIKVARASYARLLDELATATKLDLRDSTLSDHEVHERREDREQIKVETRMRLEELL